MRNISITPTFDLDSFDINNNKPSDIDGSQENFNDVSKFNIFVNFLNSNSVKILKVSEETINFKYSGPVSDATAILFSEFPSASFFRLGYQINTRKGETGNTVLLNTEYNFYLPEYEELAKTVPEHELPSPYFFLSENLEVRKTITLNGILPDKFLSNQLTSGQYFKEWTANFELPPTDNKKKRFVLVDHRIIKKEGNLHNSFPYYNSISLQTNGINLQFANQLKKFNILDNVCKIVLNDYCGIGKKSQIQTKLISNELQQQDINEVIKSYMFDMADNFDEFMAQTKAEASNNYIAVTENERAIFPSVFDILKFRNEFKKLEKATVLDLFHSKEPNIFMFEVLKCDKDGEWLQTFFIPASDEKIDFFDTQIHENSEYLYKIYAFCLVSGMRLEVGNLGKLADGSYRTAYTVENDISVLRIPWKNTKVIQATEKTLIVKDAPPLFPELSIQPFNRRSDRVEIFLKHRAGTEIRIPEAIDSEDQETFYKYKSEFETQVGFLVFKKNVLYKSDDLLGRYEVYRINEEPSSYRDFSPTVATKIFDSSDTDDSTSFIDPIQPNVKYWYCARFIDIHDNISNPTEVWEIKMTDNQDSLPLLEKKVFSFKEKEKQFSKDMMKYLLIKPSEKQSQLKNINDYVKSANNYTPQIGDVFGRQFRIEIISKKTDKKIDLYITTKAPILGTLEYDKGLPNSIKYVQEIEESLDKQNNQIDISPKLLSLV